MVKEIREKAIEQALASLRIDKIYLSQDYLNSYRKKSGLPVEKSSKLVLKRSKKNAK